MKRMLLGLLGLGTLVVILKWGRCDIGFADSRATYNWLECGGKVYGDVPPWLAAAIVGKANHQRTGSRF